MDPLASFAIRPLNVYALFTVPPALPAGTDGAVPGVDDRWQNDHSPRTGTGVAATLRCAHSVWRKRGSQGRRVVPPEGARWPGPARSGPARRRYRSQDDPGRVWSRLPSGHSGGRGGYRSGSPAFGTGLRCVPRESANGESTTRESATSECGLWECGLWKCGLWGCGERDGGD